MTTGFLLFWLIPAFIVFIGLSLDVYIHGDEVRVKDIFAGLFLVFMPLINILVIIFCLFIILHQKDFWNIVVWSR